MSSGSKTTRLPRVATWESQKIHGIACSCSDYLPGASLDGEVEAAAFFEETSARLTSSIATISAASPIRRRVFTIRVYPPGRSLNRPATSLKSFETTALLRRNVRARRRAGKVPSFPRVIMRSVNPRISFALASVVSIRSWSKRDVTRFRNNAHRCLV